VTVSVPYYAIQGNTDRITFVARSRSNPYFEDQAQLTVRVVAIRGDANLNNIIDPSDVVFLINYLFRNGPAPEIIETGDCNCDAVVDAGDVVYVISYLFRDGPLPCAP